MRKMDIKRELNCNSEIHDIKDLTRYEWQFDKKWTHYVSGLMDSHTVVNGYYILAPF